MNTTVTTKLLQRSPRARKGRPALRLLALGSLLGVVLAGCGGGSGSDSTTVAGNIPIAYAKRSNLLTGTPAGGTTGVGRGLDPLTGSEFAPGGDLIIRAVASPSAPEYNITAPITQGVGDVTDPEVSYDGQKIVFALNCPTSNTSTIGGAPACTGRWNIWEYDMTGASLTTGVFRRLTSNTQADDVGPAYLPAGAGYVFSSNRQTTSYVNQALGHSYFALDEYERQQVFNLHTMDANGNNITQISFNQSHDRNPTVRPDGSIMFSRWEHVADRNRFTIFTVKPDGTNMFVLYGAHADGNSYLHPRDMDPSGPYAGYVASDLMPLQRTQGGGAVVLINAANYSDQNTPVNNLVPTTGGQVQATPQALDYNSELSQYGRVTTPFPLWDGTNRILLSYTPCQVTNTTLNAVVSCQTLTAAELASLSNTDRLISQATADPIQNNVPASYGVYMLDPVAQTMVPVALPAPGYMYLKPVPIQARAQPSSFTPTVSNPTLAAQNMATLTVASVFDTDLLGRMGQQMLSASDLPANCALGGATPANAMIPQTTPLDSQDTRPTVANLIALKDPANPAYNCNPIRFIRAIRAVAPPAGSTGVRQAIGDTNFEQNQILGYAQVEPDGSFQINIPANTPVAFSVLDAQGRAFQVHTNWIQARPGEVRSCDGCHSPRRGAAINSGTIANNIPAAWKSAMAAQHANGDTMAQVHANYVAATTPGTTVLNNPVYTLQPDPVYTDVWADTTKAGVTARPAISLTYAGLTTTAPATTGVLAGVINYPDHIQPLWSASRPGGSCISCHSASDTLLNLSSTIAGTGRLVSYENLMVGPPLLQNGQPVLQVVDGNLAVVTGPALVYSMASEGQVVGLARQSRLIEILAGQTIMSDSASQAAYPTPTTPNHAGMLNASEMRLLTEWIDLGGKYYNDPFNANGPISVSTLDETVFKSQVYPILLSTCAANCHLARGSDSKLPAGSSFVENKFVLTGDEPGDFNNTLSMISNTCTPSDPANYLLSQPSAIPHPTTLAQPWPTVAVLPTNSANYATIAAWIQAGCAAAP